MPHIHRHRRTGFDVTDRVDVTNQNSVCLEVGNIIKNAYPECKLQVLEKAFRDCGKLYKGEYPEYRACETQYHNLQHVLDVTLATARLLDGHEKKEEAKSRLGFENCLVCLVTSLFHDSGFIRKTSDTATKHGAEYVKIHVSRSADFLEAYLKKNKLDAWIPVATRLVHFTGFEKPIEELHFEEPKLNRMGYILGTADLIAPMSDRVYLEKCRDYLFSELQLGGALEGKSEYSKGDTGFLTPDDFLRHIPIHIQETMAKRLRKTFHNAYKYASDHFNGPNFYLEAMGMNFNHIHRLIESNITHTLGRKKEGESDHWS